MAATRPRPPIPRLRARRIVAPVVAAALFLSGSLAAGSPPVAVGEGTRGASASGLELLDEVAGWLRRDYYDRRFRREALPMLERSYRRRMAGVDDEVQAREIVREFLGQVPASHLALYSDATHRGLMAELSCRARPTLGFQLTQVEGDFFVDRVFEGGPGERAGLRRGDRVLEIDGRPPLESPRLDWASDDAALPDPPLHGLLCADGEEVTFRVEREPGLRARGSVVAEPTSGCEASRSSVRIVDDGGRFGYVHLWFIVDGESSGLLEELIRGPFADCDGLLVDLRGRGGSGREVRRVVLTLGGATGWDKPVVLLTDPGTRSAKEIIAYELQASGSALVVGGRTAGAVIPASFEGLEAGGVLMFPRSTLPRYTDLLEGRGVEPDIEAVSPLPYSGGADPIFDAGVVALQVWVEDARARKRP